MKDASRKRRRGINAGRDVVLQMLFLRSSSDIVSLSHYLPLLLCSFCGLSERYFARYIPTLLSNWGFDVLVRDEFSFSHFIIKI